MVREGPADDAGRSDGQENAKKLKDPEADFEDSRYKFADGSGDGFPVVGDKGKRSQSFRTLCAMGRVRFPTFAPWWPSAKEQLLKFTGTGNDKEDDFCDMCGIMGQASAQLISAGVKKENNVIEPKVGTLAWTRWAADREKSRVAPGRIKRAW
jgi:phage terminase large subunit-like protein